MCWPVTVVVLVHLGATLTGAWRASQPRLQFTHSGKMPRLSLFLLHVSHICHSLQNHTQTHGFSFFTFRSVLLCGCPLNPLTNTLLCNMWSTISTFTSLSLVVSLSLISSDSVITCIEFFSQSSSVSVKSLSLAPPTSLSHLIPATMCCIS